MEQGMSQSLPEQVILVDIDKDNTNVEDSKRQDHDYVLRDNDGIRGDYNGFRSSYRRAIDNEELTPPASPQFQEIDIPAYLESTRQFRPNSKHNTLQRGNNSDPTLDNHRYPHSSGSDHTSYDHILDSSDTDFRKAIFPVTMERVSRSLEYQKDPQYNGIRSPKSERVVGKWGNRNIGLKNIPNKISHVWRDIVTTLVDEQWRITFSAFAMSYFVTWFVFAALFYWIAYEHGDFDLDPVTGLRLRAEEVDPCIYHTEGFSGYLLMSVESQTSIGYGTYYPSEECKAAIALLVIQIIIGVCIEGAMIGVVWIKMSRPPKRVTDQKFSRRAVICLREGKLCLVFRVDDPGRSHDINTHVEAFWLGEKIFSEGEEIEKYQQSLNLENDGKVTLLWPQTIAHIIDKNSPLYEFSAHDIMSKKFEIVLTITGNSSLFGKTSQSRTSYVSHEILWGHRFKNIISLDPEEGIYLVDYRAFDKTDVVTTALCSPKRLEEYFKSVEQIEDDVDYSEKNISEYGGTEDFNANSPPIASNDGDDENSNHSAIIQKT